MSRAFRAIDIAIALGVMCAQFLFSPDSSAQTDPQAANSAAHAPADILTEVVVTATKREEKLSDLPFSVSAISGVQLEEQQIATLDDVARAVPSLAITKQDRPGMETYAIRGISSSGTFGSLGQQPIGVYVDEVSMTMPSLGGILGTAAPSFFDASQVEVLRGPQGTLYGAGSMGGTIRVVSNQPKLDRFEGSASAMTSFTENGGMNYQADTIGNMPLGDASAARVGVQYTHNGGYIDRIDGLTGARDSNYDDDSTWTLKGAIRFEAQNGTLDVTPAIFYQNVDSNGSPYFDPNTPFVATRYVPDPFRDKLFSASLTINKDFEFAKLTSATSYWDRNSELYFDWSTSALGVGFFGLTDPPVPVQQIQTTKLDQIGEELRLASPAISAESNFSYLVGLYFAKSDVHAPTIFTLQEDLASVRNRLIQMYGDPAFVDSVFLWGGTNLDTASSYLQTKQYSAFGEVNYSPAHRLILTLGFRYFYADQDSQNYQSGTLTYSPTPLVYNAKTSNDAFTPKVAIRYELTPTTSVYANAVEGFRLGGVNQPVPTDACGSDLAALGLKQAPSTYTPDTVWNYELGIKGSEFDRLHFDVSAYQINWSKIQQEVVLPSCGFDFVANAGEARVRGFEADVSLKLPHDLTLRGTGGVTHAEIVEAVPGTGFSKGDWLLGVPRWTWTLGAQYRHAIAATSSLFANIDGRYVGPSRGATEPGPAYNFPQYFTLDGKVGVDFGNWSISLLGSNLLNEDKITQVLTLNPTNMALSIRPRTLGLSAAVKF
jgi:outer membrane receptor protein involved in Fe transport